VSLPVSPAAPAGPASPTPTAGVAAAEIPRPAGANPPNSWQRRQALVCLQDAAARQRTKAALDAQGYLAHVAEAVPSAITVFQEEPIGFVLLDPQFDAEGQGAAQVLRDITALPPRRRRRVYLVLVSPTVRTLDRQAAFLNSANLTVNSADLETLPQTLERSLGDFNELYHPLNQALGTPPL
jgi:DNA-binding NtrC family response regulator